MDNAISFRDLFRDLFRLGWPAIAAAVAWGAIIIALDILGGVA